MSPLLPRPQSSVPTNRPAIRRLLALSVLIWALGSDGAKADLPVLSLGSREPHSFAFAVSGIAGQPYTLQAAADLISGFWTNLLSFTLQTASTNLADAHATNFPARFYRLVVNETRADPTQLPRAARQAPKFESYPGRSLSAGQSYFDPVTGVRVTKLTDANVPETNQSGLHHYASGPAQISRSWGHGWHTINVTANGEDYLVDYQRGGGLTNWRRVSFAGPDLSFGFSLRADTPRIAYAVRDRTLQRYDTAGMAAANTNHFPKNFSAIGQGYLVWLQQDKDDEWFVMMLADGGKVVAWNSQSDETLILLVDQLDEPHLDRDGRYVFIARETDWLIWDLQTKTTRGPFATPFRGHPGAFRSLFAASDGNDNPAVLWRHDPFTRLSTNLYIGEEIGNGGQHRGDQWVMSDAELNGVLSQQWLLQSVHDEGEAQAGAWTLTTGHVYSATVANWESAYGKPAIGIRAVRQQNAGDPTRMAASLEAVTNITELAEGKFFYDAAATRVHVWLVGGGNPTGQVEIRAPALLHDALALVRVDGSEIRLAAHHYSLDCESQYPAMPKATISPDGKLIVFSSNMADRDGRVDVFAVEVPLKPAP